MALCKLHTMSAEDRPIFFYCPKEKCYCSEVALYNSEDLMRFLGFRFGWDVSLKFRNQTIFWCEILFVNISFVHVVLLYRTRCEQALRTASPKPTLTITNRPFTTIWHICLLALCSGLLSHFWVRHEEARSEDSLPRHCLFTCMMCHFPWGSLITTIPLSCHWQTLFSSP